MELNNQSYSHFPNNPFIFKFCFLFIVFFILIFNNNSFWFLSIISPFTHAALISIIYFITENKEALPQSKYQLTNGSGDTHYAWYALLLILIISIIGAICWHYLNRKDKNLSLLHRILTVVIRYYVGFTLFKYGLVKILGLQFNFPSLLSLTEPLSQFSPMGLAWRFMGFSYGYQLTMGIIELFGLLLLFKKTSILGACISLMVSVQVFLINYFFDVPVKMVSTALVIFSLFLLAPNIKQFYRLFFSNQQVMLIRDPTFHSSKKWVNRTLIACKYLIILSCFGFFGFILQRNINSLKTLNKDRSSLYGAYFIPNEEYSKRKHFNIPADWDLLVFQQKNHVFIRDQVGSLKALTIDLDTIKKDLYLSMLKENMLQVHYQKDKDGNLIFTLPQNDTITLRLNKINLDDIDLKTRGFNWIQNFPYNK